MMPWMIQENEPVPLWSTLTPMRVALGAMPTVPTPFAAPATMPATCVPCQKSPTSELYGCPGTNDLEAATSMFDAMSMWVLLTAPSRIATRAPSPRYPAAHAAGALMASGAHWSLRNVSVDPSATDMTTAS